MRNVVVFLVVLVGCGPAPEMMAPDAGAPLADAGGQPEPDAGAPPLDDAGATPDAGAPPSDDAGVAPPPLFGLHAGADPSGACQLGAQLVRVMVKDDELRGGLAGGESGEFRRRMDAFAAAGVTVVVTLRWPHPANEQVDRVPVGADRAAALADVEALAGLASAPGSPIRYIQVGNEPFGGPGAYATEDLTDDATGSRPALEWMSEVVAAIRAGGPSLRVIAGGITGVKSRLDEDFVPGNVERDEFLYALIAWAREETDLLDVHVHVADAAEGLAVVDWVRARTDQRLVALEVSQADASQGWLLESFDPRFAPICEGLTGLPRTPTQNRDLVGCAYLRPIPLDAWLELVEGAPLDDAFLEDLIDAAFLDGDFELVTYGGMIQYGHPKFDLKAAYANLTAQGEWPRNRTFEMVRAAFARFGGEPWCGSAGD